MNVRKTAVDSVRMVKTVNWYQEVTVYGIKTTHGKVIGVSRR